MKKLAIAAVLLLPLGACDPAPRPFSTNYGARDAIVADAQRFMADYARDLLAGDRTAVVARYDPEGTHVLNAGSYGFHSRAEIENSYSEWQAPVAFEWRNLAYEPVAPDAIVVVGQFVWTAAGRAPATYSYSALLRRSEGGLRIRVEDEAPSAPPSR